MADVDGTFKEFVEYRKDHPGSMSSKPMMVWWSNGKKIKKDTIGKCIRKGRRESREKVI